jgi:hypothetical protein
MSILASGFHLMINSAASPAQKQPAEAGCAVESRL